MTRTSGMLAFQWVSILAILDRVVSNSYSSLRPLELIGLIVTFRFVLHPKNYPFAHQRTGSTPLFKDIEMERIEYWNFDFGILIIEYSTQRCFKEATRRLQFHCCMRTTSRIWSLGGVYPEKKPKIPKKKIWPIVFGVVSPSNQKQKKNTRESENYMGRNWTKQEKKGISHFLVHLFH